MILLFGELEAATTSIYPSLSTSNAETLKNCSYVSKVEPTETNIVIFYLSEEISEETFMAEMEAKNIRLSNMGHGKLRMVTHLDYTDTMHDIVRAELLGYA